jgi:hypothetical protein
MDPQNLFNVAIGLAAFFGGYTLSSISRSLERLDRDVRALPFTYVTRTDFKSDVDEIKASLRRIEDKLESKADKP